MPREVLIIQTITFYSYKGGVGRTLALANIAMYLSRFGQNVCIVDFDLEKSTEAPSFSRRSVFYTVK